MAAAPTNDERASEVALSLGSSTAGTLVEATDSGSNICDVGFYDEDDDVWYSFVAPTSGNVDVILSNIAGDDVFPMFSVLSFDGSGLGCVTQEVLQSATVTGLTSGTLYYVQVYSQDANPVTTTFDVLVRETPTAPTNDDCADAIALTAGSPITGTSAGASSGGASTSCVNVGVWYSFVGTGGTMTVRVTPDGSEDIALEIYEGGCPAPGAEGSICEDLGIGGDFEEWSMSTLAGQQYYVYTGESSFGSPTGSFTISLTADPVAAVATATGCAATATVDVAMESVWYPITDGGGNLIAKINSTIALGSTDVNLYGHSGAIRTSGSPYASRNLTINPSVDPAGNDVRVRLYYTAAEIAELIGADATVDDLSDVVVTKVSGTSCSTTYDAGAPALRITPNTFGAYDGSNGHFIELTVTTFSEFFVSSASGAPLPVELLDFSAFAKTDHTALHWATASERNAAYFAVERSINGVDFEEIGTVTAAGDSDEYTAYSYQDYGSTSAAYYRLRSIDFDGSTDLSEVVYVDASAHETNERLTLAAYPNPTRGQLNVVVNAAAKALLVDLSGRTVRSFAVAAGEGSSVDITGLAAGIYTLVVHDGTTVAQRRIVVQ